MLGIGLAWGALRASNFYVAKMMPHSLPATLDLRVLGFAVGLTVVIGVIGAYLLSRYMSTMLFGVKPTDPAVYAVASLVLIAVALLASYLPARRAAKIDPLVALRDE